MLAHDVSWSESSSADPVGQARMFPQLSPICRHHTFTLVQGRRTGQPTGVTQTLSVYGDCNMAFALFAGYAVSVAHPVACFLTILLHCCDFDVPGRGCAVCGVSQVDLAIPRPGF